MAFSAGPALATASPTPSNEDHRIGVVRNAMADEIRLEAMPGTDLTVLMPRGETVDTVELGDVATWHVSVLPSHDGFVISALRPVAASPLAVRTSRGAYRFSLNATLGGMHPYLVRLEQGGGGALPGAPKVWSPPVIVPPGAYRLSGDKEVLPSTIRDDGRKVYIQWAASQPLPAVFALDARGREEMIDGYMREGTFTIDHLVEKLVFRLDKARGEARRIARKAAR